MRAEQAKLLPRGRNQRSGDRCLVATFIAERGNDPIQRRRMLSDEHLPNRVQPSESTATRLPRLAPALQPLPSNFLSDCNDELLFGVEVVVKKRGRDTRPP